MLNQLAELINSNVAGANATVSMPEEANLDGAIYIDGAKMFDVAKWLRSNKEMPFNVLQVISTVDYLEYIEVCYMFAHFDIENPREFILKVKLTDRVNPNIDSIVSIYAAASFQEREAYDMMGVRFNNHPDHRRILCPDDWEGYPLRKDYVYPKMYNGMEVFPDSKMNFEDREYKARQDLIAKAQKASSVDA
ncbi:MAG TPA: NADH-quinone oxidoreductase subunit C [Bacteriovoracaceae bacterium]|nr:NADH-quinone oxidoreductase subunit C [Bacteriovoracaceae bacterium]